MYDVLLSSFAETKTEQILLESWWSSPGDSRVGLDNNLSLRWSSCMICIASNSLTMKLCHLDLQVKAHFSLRFLPSILFWVSCNVLWVTLEVMGYIPQEVSIRSITSCALYQNHMDIFELKIFFSVSLQRDLRSRQSASLR